MIRLKPYYTQKLSNFNSSKDEIHEIDEMNQQTATITSATEDLRGISQ